MPLQYGGYTPTPANANLDTLPQLATLVPPIITPLLPVVPGAGRTTATVTNYLANNALGNPIDWGAVGDGANADGAKFVLTQTAVGASGTLDVFPGTFKIEQALNFTQFYKPRRGSMLKPMAGVNINFAGGIENVYFQFIDLSLGGTISFSGPLSHVRPEWVGFKGDGANADWIPLQLLTNMMPRWTPMEFRPGSNVRLDFAWAVLQKQGNRFVCNVQPQDAFINNNNCWFHWFGPDGGIMVPNYNSGYCKFEGLSFNANGPGIIGSNTASVCIDTDYVEVKSAAGSTALQTQGLNQANGTLGAAFFKSLQPNIQITLSNAGAGGAAFPTTLAAVIDDQHATLGANAGADQYQNQFTLSPAGYAAPPNNNGRISTQCFFEHCEFVCSWGKAGRLKESIGVRISKSSQANCEYNVFRHCQFFGTDLTSAGVPQQIALGNLTSRAYFNTPGGSSFGLGNTNVATTVGNMMNAGSNAIGGFNVDTFTASMNGMRWRGPGGSADLGARGYSGTSDTDHQKSLDGYFHYLTARTGALFSDPGLTVPLLAVTNVTKATPYFVLGECTGIGIQQGPSFNAKRFTTYECFFQNLAIGMDIQGGSAHHLFPNYTNNEINVAMGVNQSEPSSEYGANSEWSRCHLFFGSPDVYSIQNSRFAMGAVSPGEGYFKFVAGYGGTFVRLLGSHIENAVPSSSTVCSWSLTVANPNGGTGQAGPLLVEGCRFSDVTNASYAAALSELGWDSNALGFGAKVYQRQNNWAFAPMPQDSLLATRTDSILNGNPKTYRQGSTFWATQYVPVQADHLDAPSWSFYASSGGGGIQRPFASMWDGTVFSTQFGMEVSGYKDLPDGPAIQIDPRLGKFFHLATAQAAPNFLNLPAGNWWYNGQDFYLMLTNSRGGGLAIAPTWNGAAGGFSGSWFMPAASGYPADGKTRIYHFQIWQGIAIQRRDDADLG